MFDSENVRHYSLVLTVQTEVICHLFFFIIICVDNINKVQVDSILGTIFRESDF